MTTKTRSKGLTAKKLGFQGLNKKKLGAKT
jgi:hypothetical protein